MLYHVSVSGMTELYLNMVQSYTDDANTMPAADAARLVRTIEERASDLGLGHGPLTTIQQVGELLGDIPFSEASIQASVEFISYAQAGFGLDIRDTRAFQLELEKMIAKELEAMGVDDLMSDDCMSSCAESFGISVAVGMGISVIVLAGCASVTGPAALACATFALEGMAWVIGGDLTSFLICLFRCPTTEDQEQGQG